jgi:triphosphatase
MPIKREVTFRMPVQRSAAQLWRVLGAKPQRRGTVATYFDTEKKMLGRSAAALQLQRSGRRWLQCFNADLSDGVAVRSRFKSALSARGGQLGLAAFPLDEIRSITGVDLASIHDRLRPVFTTRCVRHSVERVTPGGQRIEIAFAQGTIEARNRDLPLHEIVFEGIESDLVPMLEQVRALIPALRLELEVNSRAERGYRLADGKRATPIKARHPRLDPKADTAVAVSSVIGGCVSQVAANVHGVAISRDPGYLHQLRVGLRRLRSGIRVFSGLSSVESTQILVDGLQVQLPALGDARDWDVVTELLERCVAGTTGEGIDMPPIVRWARRRRARARRMARVIARSSEFQQTLLDALIWAERARAQSLLLHVEPEGPQRIGEFARGKISRLARKTEQLGERCEWSDATARHGVRIRLKRLRYVCEFFADCFKRKRVRRYLERLEALQDILGELNDITTARRLLQTLGDSDRRIQLAFILGWFSAREDALILALDAAWHAFREQKRLA